MSSDTVRSLYREMPLAEFLNLKGWDRLDETHYGLFDAKPTDIAHFNAIENTRFGS